MKPDQVFYPKSLVPFNKLLYFSEKKLANLPTPKQKKFLYFGANPDKA